MSKQTPILAWCAAGALLCGSLLAATVAVAAPPDSPDSPSPAPADDGSDQAVIARLTPVRDEFIRRVSETGYKPCTAPAIELGDPPSFGHYVAKSNTLQIGAWSHLAADEKQGFEDMARQMGGQASPRSVFENGTYRWVFVHELGHWWQGCQHKRRADSYAAEKGANRIALAYWHELDPRFTGGIVRSFRGLVKSRPSPVPSGQSPEKYLNANFQKIAHTDDYIWFQAKMIAELAEQPPPTFHEALSRPLYPK